MKIVLKNLMCVVMSLRPYVFERIKIFRLDWTSRNKESSNMSEMNGFLKKHILIKVHVQSIVILFQIWLTVIVAS